MIDSITSGSISSTSPGSKIDKYLTFGLLLLTFSFGGLLSFSWASLTSCLQKQGIAVMIAFFSWHLRKRGIITWTYQFIFSLLAFGTIECLNMKKENDAPEICFALETRERQLIYALYLIFFCYFVSIFLIIVCGGMVGLGVKFYLAQRQPPQTEAAEKSQKGESIENEEFEALEKLKFSMDDANNQTSCPICLSEFEEQEEFVRLPLCNHCFHGGCIRQWLKTHCECPCCRSNIRLNLEALLKDNEEGDLTLRVCY